MAVLRNAAEFGARNGIGFSWLATASVASQCSICMKPKKPKSFAIQRRIANSMYGQAIPPKRDVHSFGNGRVAAATLARNDNLWLPANCVRICSSLEPLEGGKGCPPVTRQPDLLNTLLLGFRRVALFLRQSPEALAIEWILPLARILYAFAED